MLDTLFSGIMTAGSLSLTAFLISLFSALVLGTAIAAVYGYKSKHSAGFLMTIALLPAIVAVIIMMVNGSLGASVAVAGAFSLVRFRSNPGTAREICAVFLAMAVGLACGIGYPAFAALFAAIICIATLAFEHFGMMQKRGAELDKHLHITVPEDLEYADVFTDLFEKYTSESTLKSVKTTNLGSLNKLNYLITMKEPGKEKEFIDELRCRNGNLEISISLAGAEGDL
ncbi:MAG: DUF4956 domain-containing protein [Clostridia bacterium]|nr:DUF4956 domain-containing protein [Clostridia bacterium]